MNLENVEQSPTAKLPNTWDVIDRIGSTLQLLDHELSDMLQLSDREFEKFRSTKKNLPMTKVFSLAERLDLGFSSIATGKIDYQALSQHYFGNKEFLPERYATAALGRRRTTLCVLNYIEEMFGWQERLNVLRHFQLNETLFANIDANINFLFASDLCDYLFRYRLSESALSQIGIQTFQSINFSKARKELGDCNSVAELYEKMCLDFAPKHLEQNFIYKFSRTGPTRCLLSATPNPILEEAFKSKIIGNPATSFLRLGVVASFSTLFGLPPADVKHVSSIYQGDSEILYEIDFSLAHSVFEQRKRRGIGHPLFSN